MKETTARLHRRCEMGIISIFGQLRTHYDTLRMILTKFRRISSKDNMDQIMNTKKARLYTLYEKERALVLEANFHHQGIYIEVVNNL